MDREAIHELPNVETNAQARIESPQSQVPSRYIVWVGGGSVVVVFDRGDLRLRVSGNHTICRVECFSHVIVDTHCLVPQPFLPAKVDISSHTQAVKRSLWQEKSGACYGCYRASTK
jgi:hypothetical protein